MKTARQRPKRRRYSTKRKREALEAERQAFIDKHTEKLLGTTVASNRDRWQAECKRVESILVKISERGVG